MGLLKKTLLAVLALLLAAAGGYAAGRFGVPARTEYRERTVEVAVESAQAKQQIAELRAQIEQFSSNTRTTLLEVIRPNGTIIRRKTQQAAVSRSKESTQAKAETHEVHVDVIKYVDREVSKTTVASAQPTWRVSLLLGVSVDSLLRGELANPLPASLLGTPWVLGVSVERHIIGPLYVGLWVMTNKSFGLSVSGGF